MPTRTRTVAALVTAVAVAAVAPAAAHPTHHYQGDCWLRSVQQGDATGIHFVGVLAVAYAATTADSLPAPQAPISATCDVRVNGVVRGSVSAAGLGLAAGVASVAFPSDDDDLVEMCERVTVAGEVHNECRELPRPSNQPPPPDPVTVLLDLVNEVLDSLWEPVDAAVCPAFRAARAAGVPGIDEEGDVYVAGEPQWDCPPYDIDWG
ncbi:MAG TPA: hypothetical protein VNA20_09425 [Frankiaceae bacterium]|nr:hypothetical protein [Frankiaceae bacterium]